MAHHSAVEALSCSDLLRVAVTNPSGPLESDGQTLPLDVLPDRYMSWILKIQEMFYLALQVIQSLMSILVFQVFLFFSVLHKTSRFTSFAALSC